MADKPFTGLTAKVKLGENVSAEIIGYISGVSLELSKDIIEIIQFGAQYKEKVPSIKDWSSSVEGTAAFSSDGAQKKLWDAFESGDPITVGIYLDDNTYFEGSALMQSLSMDAAPDDKINISAELSGTGAVKLTIAGA